MKYFLMIFTALFVFLNLITYLSFSAGQANFNLTDWGDHARAFYGMIMFFVSVVSIVIAAALNDIKKEKE